MPMETLLIKTRKLNGLLQEYVSDTILFSDVAKVLSEVTQSSVMIISKKGKILSHLSDINPPFEIKTNYVDADILSKLNFINDTKENVYFNLENTEEKTCVIPITCAGKRKGTLILYREKMLYSTEDIILGEYGANVIALEILRSESKENDKNSYKLSVVKSAIGTLSYSELEAVVHIFSELSEQEGLIVASKIADRVGITRSVIVNALRKLESAGVIESRSLGMKGTYIKVLNDMLLTEINKLNR